MSTSLSGHRAKADDAVRSAPSRGVSRVLDVVDSDPGADRSREFVAPLIAGTSDGLVRLAYQYTDGRHVVTEVMLRTEAVAYMPLLGAVQVGPDRFQARVATIDFHAVA